MNVQQEILERLRNLEAAVESIQNELGGAVSSETAEPPVRPDNRRLLDELPPAPGYRQRMPAREATARKSSSSSFRKLGASFWMASGAGLAFVLAAVYFIKLVYDFGWLTPERQIGLAIIAGAGLIIGGLALARQDKNYAAFMPAVGVIILYLSIYSAHVFYQMIGVGVVIFAVGTITITSMWLSRHFGNTVYAIVAVIGAYSFPLIIRSTSPDVIDVIIYFAAWSLLFSFVSLQERKRIVYMLAMLFAIIGFDVAWRLSASETSWVSAAVYQCIQFGVFTVTAAYYSVRNKSVMESSDALWHGVALFYFYVVEYVILTQHVPEFAPFIALGSAAVLLAAYLVTTRFIDDEQSVAASSSLVSLYCSAVTAHVVFFELTPEEYFPWAALLAPVAAFLMRPRFEKRPGAFAPVVLAALIVSGIGLTMLLSEDTRGVEVFMPNIALFVYAALLYVGSRLSRTSESRQAAAIPLLYAGHTAFMVATVKTFDSGLAISIVWGIFAIFLLVLALRLQNRALGQSSLLIFAASGLKVLLYDLTGTPSLVRVLTLIVLGATLYAGGWIYQRISAPEVRNSGERQQLLPDDAG